MAWLMNQCTANFGVHVDDCLESDMDYADSAPNRRREMNIEEL